MDKITDSLLDDYLRISRERDNYPPGSPQRSDADARLQALARRIERETQSSRR